MGRIRNSCPRSERVRVLGLIARGTFSSSLWFGKEIVVWFFRSRSRIWGVSSRFMIRRGPRFLCVSSHAGFDDRSEEGPKDRVWNSCPWSMRACLVGLNAKLFGESNSL
ncbi:uncharacterized protein DS421_19g660660 [Arachis hypogaea]|uniref:Uncharacterized protein n=1 Tax=Arachis hypogaea TaxID=3818 RepID=A0A6B9VBM0_ARAHY|nr:uncharacterized protein DS421_19g660660 [Arachis hypogaea]